jgi:hypothetical protein
VPPAAGTQGVVRSSIEVERKYDVPDLDLAVPDLAGVPGVGSVSAPEEHLLEAVYYDTPDRRLRAAGITLRRRTGGTDAGWHLKLPAALGREEVAADVAAEDVPAGLAALVRSRVRDRELAPVATITTRRTVRRLLDPAGRPLAELADDSVRPGGCPPGPRALRTGPPRRHPRARSWPGGSGRWSC